MELEEATSTGEADAQSSSSWPEDNINKRKSREGPQHTCAGEPLAHGQAWGTPSLPLLTLQTSSSRSSS